MSETLVLGGKSFALKRRDDRVLLVREPSDAIRPLAAADAGRAVPGSDRLLHVPLTGMPAETGIASLAGAGRLVVAYEFDDDSGTPFLANGKINVLFEKDTPEPEIERILAEEGLAARRQHPGGVLVCDPLVTRGPEDPVRRAQSLAQRPEVTFAEPDFVPQDDPAEADPSRDTLFSHQWHLHGRHPSLAEPTATHLNVEAAWALNGRGSADVVVAVMDDGFDLTNPDLQERVVAPADFLPGFCQSDPQAEIAPADADPSAERDKVNYHGTPCAGIAIGRGGAVSGVAPGASFMPVRFAIGATDQETVLAILAYISRRADIVSCSWATKPSAYAELSSTARLVLDQLTTTGGRSGKGLVMVFSAGNDDLPTRLEAADNPDGFYYYRKGEEKGPYFRDKDMRGGWVNHPGVIAVGSVSHRGRKALYSNWGEDIHVVAPSDNFHPAGLSTRADYGSINIATTDNEAHGLGLSEVGFSQVDHGPLTYDMGGTSAAAPMIAGVCALILSADPTLSAAEIKARLAASARRDSLDLVPDAALANDARANGGFDPQTGHSAWFGFGLADANEAVRQTLAARKSTEG